MADYIKLVQGDSRPSLVTTLTDHTSGLPINIIGATVVMNFREVGAAVLTATVPASIIDGANGLCIFHWSAAPTSLDGEPGNYEGEVEITFSDGTKQTVYEILKFKLRAQF